MSQSPFSGFDRGLPLSLEVISRDQLIKWVVNSAILWTFLILTTAF